MDDRAFEALADADRRRLLSRLAATRDDESSLTVPDDVADQTLDSSALATRLHHVHLPKLAAMDYVEWSPSSDCVRPGPAFEEIAPLLAVLEEHEPIAVD